MLPTLDCRFESYWRQGSVQTKEGFGLLPGIIEILLIMLLPAKLYISQL